MRGVTLSSVGEAHLGAIGARRGPGIAIHAVVGVAAFVSGIAQAFLSIPALLKVRDERIGATLPPIKAKQ